MKFSELAKKISSSFPGTICQIESDCNIISTSGLYNSNARCLTLNGKMPFRDEIYTLYIICENDGSVNGDICDNIKIPAGICRENVKDKIVEIVCSEYEFQTIRMEILQSVIENNYIEKIVNALYGYTSMPIMYHDTLHHVIAARPDAKIDCDRWNFFIANKDNPNAYYDDLIKQSKELQEGHYERGKVAHGPKPSLKLDKGGKYIWYCYASHYSHITSGFIMMLVPKEIEIRQEFISILKLAANCIGFRNYKDKFHASALNQILMGMMNGINVSSAEILMSMGQDSSKSVSCCVLACNGHSPSYELIKKMGIQSKQICSFESLDYADFKIVLLTDALPQNIKYMCSLFSQEAELCRVRVGSSGIFADISEFPVYCRKALDVLSCFSNCDDKYYLEYKDCALRILTKKLSSQVSEGDYSPTFELLYKYDRHNNTQLCSTLYYYLSYNKSISRVCRTLFLHKNTVNNRINKIKSLTNIDDSDANSVFYFLLSYRLKHSEDIF